MTFGVAVIGAGLIGQRRAHVAHSHAESRVAVVADVDEGRAQELAESLGCPWTTEWQAALHQADVDVVTISTVNKFLVPIAIAAAELGKHVLCEKPFGRSAEEAAQATQAADEAGVKLKVGFNHRYHAAIQAAHRVCASGSIGHLLCARAAYGHGGRPGYDREWRADPDVAGGGELLDQGVHIADLCRWFLGEFTHAAGATARGFWDLAPLEDNGFALLTSEDGRVATFHTSWTQWKNRFLFEVIGSSGYVTVDGLGGSYGPETLIVGHRRPEGGAPDEERTVFEGPDLSWAAEWEDFLAAIREDTLPMSHAHDALRTMQLIAAIYEASRTRSVVPVQPPAMAPGTPQEDPR